MMHQQNPIIFLTLAHLLNTKLSSARDIAFQPILGAHPKQVSVGSMGHDDGIDIITGSDFAGLTTFANLPYVNCFADEVLELYDVAFLGAPFDTVSQMRFPYLLDLQSDYALRFPYISSFSSY